LEARDEKQETAASGLICPFLGRCPVRIDGKCNTLPPLRVRLDKGNEILCHHTGVERRQLEVAAPVLVANG
jgi:peptide/nickel transport system ATP-binding protein